MTGSSYLARNQWQAAMESPPHLKAISPSISASGPLRDYRLSGVVDFDQSIGWFVGMAVDMLERMRRMGKDVSKAGEMLNRARFNLREVLEYLPVKEIPHFQFEGLAEAFQAIMSRSRDPKSEEDLSWSYHKVNVPCFHFGGWYDIFAKGLFRNFLGMREKGGSELARQGQYFLCGPWAHGDYLAATWVGSLNFGPAASGLATFTMERHIAFFDKYLRGIEGDRPNPPVRYFVMGRNRWRNADTWPLPQTKWQRYFLHSKGRANTASGDGSLSRDNPASEPPDIFVYDPRFPVPTIGGQILPTGTLVPGPFDQTPIEERHDVLCYTTAELREEIEVTGPLSLHLFAATSTRDTDFMAKLVDVYPDGSAYNVAEGCLRARYRRSILKSQLVKPGEILEYVIDMAAISIVFGRGHRIRIDITSSNFPLIDRNMNTGNPFGEDAQGIPAVQTIYHQPDFASYIDFPAIPPEK